MSWVSNLLKWSGKTYEELKALAQEMKEFVVGVLINGRTSVMKKALKEEVYTAKLQQTAAGCSVWYIISRKNDIHTII